AAKRRRGDAIDDGHLAEQTRDFPEIIAGLQRAAVDTIDPDRRAALENDVEARAADALSEDPIPFAKEGLVEEVGYLLELRTIQVGKEREGRDSVDDVVSNRHQAVSFAEGRAVPGRVGACAADWRLRMPTAFTMAPASSNPALISIAMWKASVDASRVSGSSARSFGGLSGLTNWRNCGDVTSSPGRIRAMPL